VKRAPDVAAAFGILASNGRNARSTQVLLWRVLHA